MNPSQSSRTQTCGKIEARTRLVHARAFADTAELVLGEDDDGNANVAASLAVLAGIAASDAACCATLGRRARGRDHREAIALVSGVATIGTEVSRDLARLLDLKDGAHYGVASVSTKQAATVSVTRAQRMIAGAEAVVFG